MPLSKGDVIGSVSYTLNGEEIGKTDIVSADDVGEQSVAAMANTENKKPINIKLATILILSAAVIVFLARLVIMKTAMNTIRKNAVNALNTTVKLISKI